ncbi:MAG: hypothetical protein RIR12_978 [Bacteroidota bacterium]
MKKLMLVLALTGTMVSYTSNAQGLLGKLKGNKEKAEDAPATTATDEWGISGNYTFSTPWEMYGKKQKTCAIVFIKEENGAIVNRLELTIGKGGDVNKFILDEKLMNKTSIKLFKGPIFTPNRTEFEIMQLDNGVLFLNCIDKKGYVVLAKNADDLKNWDEETGLAKFEAEKKKVNANANNAMRKKLDENETFKKNAGKVVFMPSRFVPSTPPYPADVYKSFVTEWTPGKQMFMNAYFNVSAEEVCKSCNLQLNIVYEMGKHKVDLMQLRSSSSTFNKMIAPKALDGYQIGEVLIWGQTTYSSAVAMILHKNIADGSLKPNGTMPLKVTIYAYGDKTNAGKLAEGSIAIKYDPQAGNFNSFYTSFKNSIE